MSKKLAISAAILVLLSINLVIAGIRFQGNKKVKRTEAVTIPDDVYTIMKVSCFDCHTTGGRKMALSKVNFSEWDKYPPAKKADKASDIAEILTEKKMPPKSFRNLHPEKVPTPAQYDVIIKWAETLAENDK